MSEWPHPSLAPLSRPAVTLLYVFEGAVLVYFVYGALQGQLDLPSKRGGFVLHGWGAWVACLFPLGFMALAYFRFDPSVKVSLATRKTVMVASFAVALLGLLVAAVWGPRL